VCSSTPADAEQRTLERGHRALKRELNESSADAGDARLRALNDDDDGAEIDEDGFFPAILAMASFASAPASAFFAPHSLLLRRTTAWTPDRAIEVVLRTGISRTATAQTSRHN